MQTDPVIAQMATANNYAAADRVMIALGLEHQVRDLVPKYEAAMKEIEGLRRSFDATSARERRVFHRQRPERERPPDALSLENPEAWTTWISSGHGSRREGPKRISGEPRRL